MRRGRRLSVRVGAQAVRLRVCRSVLRDGTHTLRSCPVRRATSAHTVRRAAAAETRRPLRVRAQGAAVGRGRQEAGREGLWSGRSDLLCSEGECREDERALLDGDVAGEVLVDKIGPDGVGTGGNESGKGGKLALDKAGDGKLVVECREEAGKRQCVGPKLGAKGGLAADECWRDAERDADALIGRVAEERDKLADIDGCSDAGGKRGVVGQGLVVRVGVAAACGQRIRHKAGAAVRAGQRLRGRSGRRHRGGGGRGRRDTRKGAPGVGLGRPGVVDIEGEPPVGGGRKEAAGQGLANNHAEKACTLRRRTESVGQPVEIGGCVGEGVEGGRGEDSNKEQECLCKD
ncbi:hypothetical protein PMAC_000978 [Pneumocystis sp. 'macacae']|nr:hypothetical protein PMAC_000978 [Pneumocystis sp. 'macacae']